MLKPKQPSLRNFAVLQMTKRTLNGSFWLIQDRRAPTQTQLLLVPSRLVAWPRLVAIFQEQHPAVAKIRSGQVALLFSPDFSVQNIQRSKRRWVSVKLDALSGFTERKLRLNPVLLALPAIVLCVYLSMTQTVPAKSFSVAKPEPSAKELTCSRDPEVGMKIATTRIHESSVELDDTMFHLQLLGNMGGFVKLKLTRTCDHKQFKLEAWKATDYYLVSKVN